MLTFTIRKGLRFKDANSRSWTIDRILLTNRIHLVDELGALQSLTRQELLQRWGSSEWSIDPKSVSRTPDTVYHVTNRDIAAYTAEQQALANFRLEVIRPLLTKRRITNHVLETLCSKFRSPVTNKPPSIRSARRWACAYRRTKDITCLIDHQPRRRPHDHPEFLDLFEQVITDEFLKPQRPPRLEVVERITAQLEELNATRAPSDQITIPSHATLYRRLKDINTVHSNRYRFGADEAKRLNRVAIAMVKTKRILERVELDHSRIDVVLIDTQTGAVLGRPWLTLAIDHYSKMIVGFYLSFDCPSATSVLHCLVQAVLPKEELLRRYPGIANDWPAAGLMLMLVVDNGMDLHAARVQELCVEIGTNVTFCPRKTAWFKALVERTFRTMNNLIHQFPGTTFSNTAAKLDYDSEKYACLGLEKFEEILVRWIVDIHNVTPHRRTKMPPLERWRLSAAQCEIDLPASPADLHLLTGVRQSRRVHRYGIEHDQVHYNSTALQDLARRLTGFTDGDYDAPSAEYRYYDDTLEYIDVLDPETKQYMRVSSRDEEYTKGLNRRTHRLIQQKLRDAYGDKWRLSDRREARRKIDELVANALVNKKKLNRKAKRDAQASTTAATQIDNTPAQQFLLLEQTDSVNPNDIPDFVPLAITHVPSPATARI